MQIETTRDTDKKIKEASKVLGLEEEDIIERAITLYLDNIQKYVELKRELKDWDALSDEAFMNFERSL